MKRLKSRKFFVLFALMLLGAAFYIFKAEKITTYLTESVKRSSIELNILADGKMEAFKQVEVGAQVSGQIKKLHVVLGEQVEEGDLLAEIDDLPQQNAVKDGEARLKNVIAAKAAKEAQIVNAALRLERQQRLIRTGATTQSDLDLAEADVKVLQAELDALEAQIDQAEVALETAKHDLSYTKIKAPMAGTVVAIVVKEGQTVNAVQSAPTIVKVADLSKMVIKAQISEADIPKVRLGMKANFTILGEPNERYEAELIQIEPSTEAFQNTAGNVLTNTAEAVYYNGIFYTENREAKFYIGMTTQIYIITDYVSDVLTIPSMATRFSPKNATREAYEKELKEGLKANPTASLVWVENKKNNQLRPRFIQTGLSNNISIEVLEGLTEGEEVVLSEVEMDKSKITLRHPQGMSRLSR